MKFTLALLSLIGMVSAKKPQVSISVRDGNFADLDGLDPTLSWENSGNSGDLDFSYGIKAAVRPTTDIASLPRNIWGKVSTDVSGWGVSARADVDGQNLRAANIEVDAENQDLDLSVHADCNAGDDFSVSRVQATKGFDQGGARVTVTPRLNLVDDDRDVVIDYDNDKTNVKLTVSAENQEVTFSQQIDNDNRIAPTINNSGDISVAWERRLAEDNSLTTTFKPGQSLDVEWRDSDWTANVNMPIDNKNNLNGANVSIKRDVNF